MALAGVLIASPRFLPAAGVTLITHGNSGNTDGWVKGMANALSQRMGGNVPIYRIDVTSVGGGFTNTFSKVSGALPSTTPTGEVIVILDWRTLANSSYSTFNVANSVGPAMAQTNFIPELGGHALAEFPIHIIGHSRGGSLVCELSQRLGEKGIWVNQVTTLDAYPLGNDAPVLGYENVLFAESYYQTDYIFFDGIIIPGSHWRRQTSASGGYTLFSDWHSDVHLWYHGTLDRSPTASDTEVTFTTTMRDAWWTAPEQKGTNAGFIYSRLGGGNRYSTLQPNGANSSAVRDGINRNFELGAGVSANRTTLIFNTGDWPNVIKLDLLTTNPSPHGTSADLQIYFQWAQPASLLQTVQVFLDLDNNPLNGNEQLLTAGTASGTTSSQIGTGIITAPLAATNAPAGSYRVFVKLTVGGRSRLLYAPSTLTVVASTAAPLLDIRSGAIDEVVVGINGVPGQTVVLLKTTDFDSWLPVTTNVLNAARWEISQPASGSNVFYRAVLLP